MSNQVRHFQKAIHKQPRDARAWFGLGRELMGLNDPQAVTVLREAAVLSDDAELCAAAGRLLAANGHVLPASDALQKALALGGDLAIASELAKSLLAAGDIDATIDVFRRYLPEPEDPEPCWLLASALAHRGREEEAVEHLRRGLSRSSAHVPSLRLMGHLEARMQNSRVAVECIRRVLALGDPTTDDLVVLGTSLSDLGEHEEAIRILGEARRRSPEDYEILANLGTAHIATGEITAAVDALMEAVRVRPNGAHARCMLGVALHQAGRSTHAVEHLREACRLQPDWVAAHFNLGKLLVALGDIEGARASFLEAQRVSPDDPDVKAQLAALPEQTDRPSGSITGDLEAFRLPDLLEFLRVQRSTGTLLLGARHGAGLLRLFEGELIGASAPATPRLGEILVREGSIDPSVLSSIVEQQRVSERLREEPELLGTILLKKQIVGAERLHSAMMEQVLAALGEMMTWTSGQFAFHARAPGTRPSLSFDVQRLMLEAARRADEADR
jgi:Flp pilus assembly protein TadD